MSRKTGQIKPGSLKLRSFEEMRERRANENASVDRRRNEHSARKARVRARMDALYARYDACRQENVLMGALERHNEARLERNARP